MSDQPTTGEGEQLDIVDAVAKYGIKKLEPTGEWQWDQVDDLYRALGIMGIVKCHNAALAAEERRANDSIVETVRLMNELAAEREEHAKALLAKQTRIEIFQQQLAAAVEALQSARTYIWDCGYFDASSPLIREIDATLEKIGGK